MSRRNMGPDYAIKVAFQVGRSKKWSNKEIGVGFAEDDGSITIKIHPGMALVPQPGVTVKAWPIDEDGKVERNGRGRRGGGRRRRDDDDDGYGDREPPPEAEW